MVRKTSQDFEMFILLQQARDSIYNARNRELSKFDLSSRESAILHSLISLGNTATPTMIARRIYRKPHTVAGILNRMQKKGLVQLTKDPEVKNLVRISMTEEGQKVYKSTLLRKSIRGIFSAIDDDEFNQLEVILTKIRDKALKQTGDTIHRKFPL